MKSTLLSLSVLLFCFLGHTALGQTNSVADELSERMKQSILTVAFDTTINSKPAPGVLHFSDDGKFHAIAHEKGAKIHFDKGNYEFSNGKLTLIYSQDDLDAYLNDVETPKHVFRLANKSNDSTVTFRRDPTAAIPRAEKFKRNMSEIRIPVSPGFGSTANQRAQEFFKRKSRVLTYNSEGYKGRFEGRLFLLSDRLAIASDSHPITGYDKNVFGSYVFSGDKLIVKFEKHKTTFVIQEQREDNVIVLKNMDPLSEDSVISNAVALHSAK